MQTNLSVGLHPLKRILQDIHTTYKHADYCRRISRFVTETASSIHQNLFPILIIKMKFGNAELIGGINLDVALIFQAPLHSLRRKSFRYISIHIRMNKQGELSLIVTCDEMMQVLLNFINH